MSSSFRNCSLSFDYALLVAVSRYPPVKGRIVSIHEDTPGMVGTDEPVKIKGPV